MGLEKLREVYQEYKQGGMRLSFPIFEQKVKEIRSLLIEVAKRKEKITYGGIMKRCNISRAYVGVLVGAVSDIEYRQGGPLLSALVVRKDTGRPGGGFLGLEGVPQSIRRSGREIQNPKYSDAEEEFWRKELDKVYSHYSR